MLGCRLVADLASQLLTLGPWKIVYDRLRAMNPAWFEQHSTAVSPSNQPAVRGEGHDESNNSILILLSIPCIAFIPCKFTIPCLSMYTMIFHHTMYTMYLHHRGSAFEGCAMSILQTCI